MFRAALGFFILALVSVVVGVSLPSDVSLDIGRALMIVFLILAVISFVAGIMIETKNPTDRY